MMEVQSDRTTRIGEPGRLAMKGDRIHSLDGLRAFAITLVLLQHLHSSKTIPFLDYLWRFELLGDIGVRVFFVISGFLITTLLHREHARSGKIDLKAFYIRRALRIWPAYYSFLVVVAAGVLLGLQPFGLRDLVGPALFLTNYVGSPIALGHTWSLAVEEQFYLLWPFILVALGWRRAPWLVLAFCIAAPVLRGILSVPDGAVQVLWTRFENTGDAIGWGCLYALASERRKLPRLSTQASAVTAVVAAIALLVMSMFSALPTTWNVAGTVAADLTALILLHSALNAQGTFVHWLLNNRAVRTVGVLSYSLYLWQQVFVYGGFKLGAPANLLAIATAAMLSYYLIERPFLRLKDRLPTSSRESPTLGRTASASETR